jgi:hypothetical protein
MFLHCFWRVTSLIIENKNESVVNINYFFSASQPNQIKPLTPPSANPFRGGRGFRGWGGLIRHRHATVVANSTTMCWWCLLDG